MYQKINTECKQCIPQSHPLHFTKFIVKLTRLWMREEDKMYREGIQEMKQEALRKNQVKVIDGKNLI